jgi:succinate dehydrogenase / fumarate reductase iron-sulfur subunit
MAPRRARARGVLRRSLPRGVPDERRGAARRRRFCYVAAWEYQGVGKRPNLHKEPLEFEYVKLPAQPEELQMKITLKSGVSRAAKPQASWSPTRSATSAADMSFLEMLDILNDGSRRRAAAHRLRLTTAARASAARARMVVNGRARPGQGHDDVPALHAQLQDGDGDRGRAVARQGVPGDQGPRVDRGLRPHPSQAGGYVSVNTGAAPDANAIPVPKADADAAFDAAQCIGCGACVAACKNASAMLFVGAKVSPPRAAPPGPARARQARRSHGRADGQGGLRQLHQPGRV